MTPEQNDLADNGIEAEDRVFLASTFRGHQHRLAEFAPDRPREVAECADPFLTMPRIRNFKDLIFFRASEKIAYPYIDQLFGESGRNVIDWKLIDKHGVDLMQVAISISEGPPVLGHVDAAPAARLPQEPHLQGLP